MVYFISKRLSFVLSCLAVVVTLGACQSGVTAATPAPTNAENIAVASPVIEAQTGAEGSLSVEVDFGPGSFNLADPGVGLSDLTSYKATLVISFDGMRAGQPEQWSRTYVMLANLESAARQLTIEKTGAISDLAPVFMAEMDGAAYERKGENACFAAVVQDGNSLAGRWEPAGFLTGVIGAETAGNETVNGLATNHFTFDERAVGLLGIATSTGGMWVDPDGGYLVKYDLTTVGNADYFGEEIEGTLTLNYELTSVNQPVPFDLPGDCPAGMVNAPQLPDASNIQNMPGLLMYATSSSLPDTVSFYQNQIPGLGWTLLDEPVITEKSALLDYSQGDQNLSVILTTGDTAGTMVRIVLGRLQK